MNRLWVRLTVAFALVAAVAVLAIALLMVWQADNQFRQYVTHTAFLAQDGLADSLAAYYGEKGSWREVEALLESTHLWAEQRPRGRFQPPRGRPFLVLADTEGQIVYGEPGGRLSNSQKSAAVPVTLEGVTVGYLTSTTPRAGTLGPLEQGFLSRFRTSLGIGAGVAGALGLMLGLLLSRSLSAPLSKLTGAARAVASGDFSQRVEVRGSTELIEVGRSFNEMTVALQEAETLRRNLMADVAHELRTPLTVVQGNLRALLDDVYPLEKAEIAQLYDETRLLSRLVEDLRELALAEAGQLRLHLRPTDVADVVRTTVSTFSTAAEQKGLELTLDVDRSLPPVKADPGRLAQILRNLLSNALRHTPPHGQIRVSASSSGGFVQVSVTDTGDGVPGEEAAHVFDRFWRSDSSRSRESGGSGLGLAIAKQLVEAQGGEIAMKSETGGGSCFWFTVPALADRASLQVD